MEKQRKIKILSIVALVLAICALTLGYAAFSTTLNISSSASVSPNSDDFSIKITTVNDDFGDVDPIGYDADVATMAKIVGTSLTGIVVNFTEPEQEVYYRFFVYNSGKYDAYLNSISFGDKNCSAKNGATLELVNAACEGISRKLTIENGDDPEEIGYELFTFASSSSVSDLVIAPGERLILEYYISYDGDNRADGPFDVTFGDLSLEFSTVDSSNNLISFSIDGTTYQAEDGMTLGEWYYSNYNSWDGTLREGGFFYTENEKFILHYGLRVVYSSHVITDGDAFYVEEVTIMPSPMP